MHVYLIRHADPDYEIDGLTPQGHQEGAALAQRLAGYEVDTIYSSTAGRAMATAQYTADLLNLEIEAEAWLVEPRHLKISQQGQPYHIWDTFGETTRAQPTPPGPSDWNRRPPFDAPEIWETWQAFRGKADALLARHGYHRQGGRYRIERAKVVPKFKLSQRQETADQDQPNFGTSIFSERPNREQAGNRVAIFSHNGTVLFFLAHLLELPPSLVWCGFFAWPASVTTIYFEEHSAAWAVPRALHVADVSHIIQAGLTPQPRALGSEPYEPYL